MKENLQRLYNTLVLIETKGEGTKLMGQCLSFLENLINDVDTPAPAPVEPVEE